MRVIVVALVLACASTGLADGLPQRLWDTHGCWINRARRDPPDRNDREELGHARPVRGEMPPGYVAFTFDDGPSEKTTRAILDALDDYDIPAAFFVVGWRLQSGRRGWKERREILSEIVRRGHIIGNHTFRHPRLNTVGRKRQRAEIDRAAEAIESVLGFRPYLFRPPYARLTRAAHQYLEKRGYTIVRWTVDPTDFRIEDPERLRHRAVTRILAAEGGVVLLHDTKEWTAQALPAILDDLLAENCRRLKAGKTLIVPVSLHYFIRERDGRLRAIPDAVAARTARYRRLLHTRCKSRIDKAQVTN